MRVLALAEPGKILCVDGPRKAIVFGKLALPLSKDGIALLPVVLLSGRELFRVIRLRLHRVERFGYRQHGALMLSEWEGRGSGFVLFQVVLWTVGIGVDGVQFFFCRFFGIGFRSFRLKVNIRRGRGGVYS